MIKFRKHITFLIFLIFLFPLFFQSIHVIWHHSHGFNGEIISLKVNNTKNIDTEKETCSIGDYKFSITYLPIVYVNYFVINIFKNFYNKIVISQIFKITLQTKSTRAPPLFL